MDLEGTTLSRMEAIGEVKGREGRWGGVRKMTREQGGW